MIRILRTVGNEYKVIRYQDNIQRDLSTNTTDKYIGIHIRKYIYQFKKVTNLVLATGLNSIITQKFENNESLVELSNYIQTYILDLTDNENFECNLTFISYGP